MSDPDDWLAALWIFVGVALLINIGLMFVLAAMLRRVRRLSEKLRDALEGLTTLKRSADITGLTEHPITRRFAP